VQGDLETIHLSDYRGAEYQNPCNAEETETEIQIDMDASNICEGTTSGPRHVSYVSLRQGKG